MTRIERGDVLGGFPTWEEVTDGLQHPWEGISDRGGGLVLHRSGQELGLLDHPGRPLKARQRRALHRLSFRSLPLRTDTLWWRWDPQALPAAEVGTLFDAGPRQAEEPTDAVLTRLRAYREAEELVRQRAVQVLRDVLLVPPERVLLHLERESWSEAEDGEDMGWWDDD